MSDLQGEQGQREERVRHRFSSQERYVLINLAEQILELLGQSSISHDPLHDLVGISGNELPPDDPVLKRLLPSAYQELQDAAEFRRYTEDALREKKRAHARVIREMLLDDSGELGLLYNSPKGDEEKEDNAHIFVHGESEVSLSALTLEISGDDLWAWLGGLNDIRLALAVRLDIGGPTMGDLPNDGHRNRSRTGSGSGSGESGIGQNEGAEESSEGNPHIKYQLMKESDPMKAVYAVYSWLGWLQENFLRQMDPDEDDESVTKSN
jgi:hypothetical protein